MLSEKKVLVVDDEEAILDILTQAFSASGYVVRAAEDAEKAVEILRQESIFVMFFDLNLPGMSGMQLCEQVRKQNPVAVIHALTGYADLYNLLDCRKVGFDDFFAKPVNLGILLKAAKDAFEKIARWNVEGHGLM